MACPARWKNEAKRRGFTVFDATCPLVTKVHLEVARYARDAPRRGADRPCGASGGRRDHGAFRRFAWAATSIWSRDVEDARELEVRRPETLAFVTQTTLSVDDTAGHCRCTARALSQPASAAHRGHLLRHAEPPGRGEEAAGSNAMCWSWWVRSPVRTPIACVSWRTAPAFPATWSMVRTTCSGNGLKDGSAVGVTAGASAPELLVQQVVERLRILGRATAGARSWAGKRMWCSSLPRSLRPAASRPGQPQQR